ncbi:hypothetical protein OHA61_22415 [Streptomyces sp. NBC_00885]|uniref:hypothetical protein n=1 Tax=Streptomyces sp. NBC_00885 TaxID=2975857 RepID=UPI00386ACD5F|nr:hypothetical protein OHA61_22415 [Streptomyces sp. NBC_00885]
MAPSFSRVRLRPPGQPLDHIPAVRTLQPLEVQVRTGLAQRGHGLVARSGNRMVIQARDACRERGIVPFHHRVPQQALGGGREALVRESQLAVFAPGPP